MFSSFKKRNKECSLVKSVHWSKMQSIKSLLIRKRNIEFLNFFYGFDLSTEKQRVLMGQKIKGFKSRGKKFLLRQ